MYMAHLRLKQLIKSSTTSYRLVHRHGIFISIPCEMPLGMGWHGIGQQTLYFRRDDPMMRIKHAYITHICGTDCCDIGRDGQAEKSVP